METDSSVNFEKKIRKKKVKKTVINYIKNKETNSRAE